MTRYTPPSDDRDHLTSERFRRRPAWIRFSAWACVVAVIALTLTTIMSVFV